MWSSVSDTSAIQGSTTPPGAQLATNQTELEHPRLKQSMLDRLFAYGKMERLAPEALLFQRGDREVDMFVILDGLVEVFGSTQDAKRRVVARLSERQFTGN